MAEQRITWRGVRLNRRTANMLEEAERLTGFRFVATQGSYNRGGVPASAGTHDGGGAADLRARDLTTAQRHKAVLCLRRVGFAAWLRTPRQGDWPYHIHAIAAGDQDLSRGARNQVTQYRRGRNGLANHGPDDGPGGYRAMTWELYQQLKTAGNHDRTVSMTAIQKAARGERLSGRWAHDAAQFMAFALATKAIPLKTLHAWHRSGRNRRYFVYAIRCVQRTGRLPQDGVFGPVTADYMRRRGNYTITR